MLSHCHVPFSRAHSPDWHGQDITGSCTLPQPIGPGVAGPDTQRLGPAHTHPPQLGRPGYLLPTYSTVTPVDPDSDDIDHSITTPSARAGLSHMRPDSDGTDGSITAQALLFAPVVP